MRITLTGRRLALAAVLVLGGVTAPLAYGAITGTKSPATAAPAVPLAPAVASSTQAPTSSGDNPYQVLVEGSNPVAGDGCNAIPTPAGQDFVLESVTFLTTSLDVNRAELAPQWKTGSGVIEIPLDQPDRGAGTRTFNLLVRPDTFANAAVGDIYGLNYCVRSTAPASFTWIVTGQKVASAPTTADVAAFRARPGKTGVTLNWTTGSEAEILGFNIWRYRGAKGVKLNRTLVRAKRSGEPAGASYRYVDYVRGAKRGLSYRLQLVDLKGKRTWYAAFAIASK